MRILKPVKELPDAKSGPNGGVFKKARDAARGAGGLWIPVECETKAQANSGRNYIHTSVKDLEATVRGKTLYVRLIPKEHPKP